MATVWTKDAERAQLAKIVALIEETEPGSYIRMSFSGIPEMCAENITNNSANNMPDRLDVRDKRIAELESALYSSVHETEKEQTLRKIAEQQADDAEKAKEDEIERLENERDTMTDLVQDLHEDIDAKADAIDELRRDIAGMERKLADKDAEIMRLKACLYDYIIAEKAKASAEYQARTPRQ